MAVINSPWVGIAKGRLGQGVYLHSKGQTVARSYNPSPLNRRTYPQQSQRAVFSSAVKFYSRGVQNLFNFAFEDKRSNESDYNAFMRYNAKRGMYFTPAQNESDIYPSIGDFAMTRGSLVTPAAVLSDGGRNMCQVPVSNYPTTAITTVGQLSEALIAGGYSQGDIFTALTIITNWESGDESAPLEAGDRAADWLISQFTVDVSSEMLLSSTPFSAQSSGSYINIIQTVGEMLPEIACGYTWVVSRVSDGQVYVSSSDLKLNRGARLALTYGRSDTWLALVLEAWDSESPSILQGSQSVNDAKVKLTLTKNFDLPVLCSSLVSGESAITLSEALTAEELTRRVVFTYSPTADGAALACIWVINSPSFVLLKDPDGTSITTFTRDSSDYRVWTVSYEITHGGYLRRIFVLN